MKHIWTHSMFYKVNFLMILLYSSLLSGCFNESATKTVFHSENALSINLSVNGEFVLIAHSKGYIELRSVSNDKVIAQWQHDDSPKAGVIAADFSVDNKFVVTAEQNTLALFDIVNKKTLYFWSLNDIRDIKLSADGEYALVSSRDKSGEYPLYRIVYFHLRTGGIKYAFYHDDVISSVALSEDMRYALSGSDDGKAQLWDLKTGELKQIWKHKAKLSKVALSPDGKYAMTNESSGKIYLWSTKTGKLLQQFNKIRATVSAAVFSSDSHLLATGYSREEIVVWDVKTGHKVKTLRPKRRYFWQSSLANVTSLAFQSKKILMSETSRGILQTWDISVKK